MPFRLTEEDFERYVTMEEHGGRHIWHGLQDRLAERYGVPFGHVPYIARGDRLALIWFYPKEAPRDDWGHEAQLFLRRRVEERELRYGLTVECRPRDRAASEAAGSNGDADRLIRHLERQGEFSDLLDDLLDESQWTAAVSLWEGDTIPVSTAADAAEVIAGIPRDRGWQLDIERTLAADEAVGLGEAIIDEIMDAYDAVEPLWAAVMPPADRRHLGLGAATDSNGSDGMTEARTGGTGSSRLSELVGHFEAAGYLFSPLTVATYFTALQTKGFVILSGLSGTGKTKLAQHFARLIEQASDGESNDLFLSVRPDWRDGRPLLGYYNPLSDQYETSALIRFILDARQEETGPRLATVSSWLEDAYERDRVRSWYQAYVRIVDRLSGVPPDEMTEEDLQLLWNDRSNGIASVGQARPIRADADQLREATAIVQDMSRTIGQRIIDTIEFVRSIPDNVTPYARTLRAVAAYDPVSTTAERHALRGLLEHLGYDRRFRIKTHIKNRDVEAIDHAYDFLEHRTEELAPTDDPLLRALSAWLMWEYLSGQAEDQHAYHRRSAPFFVVLDEMNLARVEYYFADFLSVLESGRENSGYTREHVRLHDFPDDATDDDGESRPQDVGGRYVPPELRLPPNLYIVGTVNVDETTHAFSPKVLDRAFTLEITNVDLERYPMEIGDGAGDSVTSATFGEELMDVFTRGGRFARISKDEVSRFASEQPAYRRQLATLKDALQPFELHFGYRVFDEIMAFCANAQANELWDGLGGVSTAFDAAVLMKILPKFHGPRSRLTEPLREVLSWAHTPAAPEGVRDAVTERTSDLEACLALRGKLDSGGAGFRYPLTARKATRMLQELHSTGFASFA